MENTESFKNNDYSDSKIQRVSKSIWYMVNSQYRSEYINEMQVTQLELQDSIHLGELHEASPTISSIYRNGERPYEFFDDVHMEIVYEVNLDLRRLRRSVYSLLDWIGDVGGLFEAMSVVFGLIVAAYQYKVLEQYLVRNLFMWKEFKGDQHP